MTAAAGCDRPASLWRHGDFVRLFAAQTVSLVGTQVTVLALPLTAILKLSATPFQVGLIGTLQYLPFLLVTLPAGAILDRLRQLPVMVGTDLARAVLLFTVPLAAWLDHLSLALLYPVAFAVGVLSVFNEVSQQSYLPAIVAPEHLVEGNTKLQLSYTGAQFAGPGLGGLLVQLFTAPIAILLDAVSYAGSAVLLLTIRGSQRPVRSGRRPELRVLARDVGEGVRFVWRHRLIRPLALATGTSNFCYLLGITGAVLTLYAIRVLQLSPVLLGAALAVGNLGAVLGSLAAPRLLRRWPFGRVMVVSALSCALAVAAMALATPGTAMLLLAAGVLVGEFGVCIYDICQISLRQAVTPPALLGRMNATVRFINWGPIPLGAFLGGVLGQTVGLRPTLWVAAVGCLLSVLPVLLSEVRGLAELPTAPVTGAPDVPAGPTLATPAGLAGEPR